MGKQGILSRRQIEQFHRDGFLVVRAMYKPEEISQISDWTNEIAAWPEQPGKTMMYFETNLPGVT